MSRRSSFAGSQLLSDVQTFFMNHPLFVGLVRGWILPRLKMPGKKTRRSKKLESAGKKTVLAVKTSKNFQKVHRFWKFTFINF